MTRNERKELLYEILALCDVELYERSSEHWSIDRWKRALDSREDSLGENVITQLTLLRLRRGKS